MNSQYGNNVGVVFCIEVFQIRKMLEIVGIHFTAVNYLVGLYVVGVFDDVKGDILFS